VRWLMIVMTPVPQKHFFVNLFHNVPSGLVPQHCFQDVPHNHSFLWQTYIAERSYGKVVGGRASGEVPALKLMILSLTPVPARNCCVVRRVRLPHEPGTAGTRQIAAGGVP
jgi:hypothetical protein